MFEDDISCTCDVISDIPVGKLHIHSIKFI